MKKAISVATVVLALTAISAPAIASEEDQQFRNVISAVSPNVGRVLDDMARVIGKTYSTQEMQSIISDDPQFTFRLTMMTLCSPCYADVVSTEAEDERLWSIEEIITHDWQWKSLVNPS